MLVHAVVPLGEFFLSVLTNPEFISGPGIWVLIGSVVAFDMAMAVIFWAFPSFWKWMLC